MMQLDVIEFAISSSPVLKNRMVFSLFSLLISILLLYFWNISRDKMRTTKKDGNGLIYLSVVFLLYFIIGFMSIYDLSKIVKKGITIEESLSSFHPPLSYFIISGLISWGILSSSSFFTIGRNKVDKIISDSSWKNGIKYFAFAWIIVVSTNSGNMLLIGGIDIFTSVFAFLIFGLLISRYFILRGLNFLGLISGIFFIVMVSFQIVLFFSGSPEERFIEINTYLLAPAMALSVIILSYTFNWINELNFYELSRIWVGEEPSFNESGPKSNTNRNRGQNQKLWKEKIAKDKIETVIDEIIILKKYENENLENILNIASRNTRNNNNHMKGIIKYEDYQLNRNQISDALIKLLID